jgi:hypothetical protein
VVVAPSGTAAQPAASGAATAVVEAGPDGLQRQQLQLQQQQQQGKKSKLGAASGPVSVLSALPPQEQQPSASPQKVRHTLSSLCKQLLISPSKQHQHQQQGPGLPPPGSSPGRLLRSPTCSDDHRGPPPVSVSGSEVCLAPVHLVTLRHSPGLIVPYLTVSSLDHLLPRSLVALPLQAPGSGGSGGLLPPKELPSARASLEFWASVELLAGVNPEQVGEGVCV